MPKCKNCNNLYNLSNKDDVIVGKWCPKINDSPHLDMERNCEHYKAMTNADRIRSMTDEELAKWFDAVTKDILGGSTWDKKGCIKQGFTLDSILKSREKQTAKKIEIFNGQASCPNCKHFFGEMNVIRSLIAWNMPYCKHCGQKLDWSDEE